MPLVCLARLSNAIEAKVPLVSLESRSLAVCPPKVLAGVLAIFLGAKLSISLMSPVPPTRHAEE